MKKYNLVAEDVPVIAETEVLVVGSGTAGIAAAVSAARCGAKVMIVERYGCLGGALTVSNVSSYSFSVNQFPETLSGIAKEIDERCRAYGAGMPDYRGSGICIDAELYKCMLDEWMQEEGVNVLLHTIVVGAYVEDDVLKGVYCYSKSGFGIILAERTIDATGDGDVSALAGVPFEKRDVKELQPTTVVFGISNVDTNKFLNYWRSNPKVFYNIFQQAADNGEWDSPKRGGAWKILTPYGDIKSLNLTLVKKIDATNVFDLTYAEMEGRKQIRHMLYLFRKYGKDIGLAECELRSIAPQLGLRETRRIVGEYRLTADDVREHRDFSDGIGRLICCIDLYGDPQNSYRPTSAETFAIPYRSLLPRKIEGLLVAGRCISCDFGSFGAVRLMVGCALTGQATGTAAALSLKEKCMPRQLNTERLREQLKNSGMML